MPKDWNTSLLPLFKINLAHNTTFFSKGTIPDFYIGLVPEIIHTHKTPKQNKTKQTRKCPQTPQTFKTLKISISM